MKKQSGFTLIEILLYVVIIAVILLTTSGFIYTILTSQTKSQTIAEVEQQGVFVLQILTQTVRNATLINSPDSGASASTLSVNTTESGNNPTIFDLSGGVIRIKEGTGAVINLTNSKVIISGLTFQNLNGSIKLQFTITHVNSSGRNEYDYNKTFYGSANIRQ